MCVCVCVFFGKQNSSMYILDSIEKQNAISDYFKLSSPSPLQKYSAEKPRERRERERERVRESECVYVCCVFSKENKTTIK